jgi:hypothetical protein
LKAGADAAHDDGMAEAATLAVGPNVVSDLGGELAGGA